VHRRCASVELRRAVEAGEGRCIGRWACFDRHAQRFGGDEEPKDRIISSK